MMKRAITAATTENRKWPTVWAQGLFGRSVQDCAGSRDDLSHDPVSLAADLQQLSLIEAAQGFGFKPARGTLSALGARRSRLTVERAAERFLLNIHLKGPFSPEKLSLPPYHPVAALDGAKENFNGFGWT